MLLILHSHSVRELSTLESLGLIAAITVTLLVLVRVIRKGNVRNKKD